MGETINNIEIELRNSTIEAKIEFILDIISQPGVPNDVKSICCDHEKLFYELKDGNKTKREWVSFFNNKFFCIYCLCFSTLDNNRFVQGVVFGKNCRITNKVQRHEKEKNHELAKRTYAKYAAEIENKGEVYQSAQRNAIKCIVKIIIFIATHGEYCYIAILCKITICTSI